MKTHTVTTYNFAELSDKAKEHALEKLRDINVDYDWWDATYDDAKQCAECMGIEIKNIWFSGFWSQGDGACFEGFYYFKPDGVAKITEHAPQDTELHRIAAELAEVQAAYPNGKLAARVKHRGHYYHAGCTEITVDVDCPDATEYVTPEHDKQVCEALRDFMNWIYKRLEEEHDYLTKDEQVIETIDANEYDFDANGNIWRGRP